jgi:biopolymer transport protein ExbB
MFHHISPTVIIDGTLYALLVFSVVTWTLILFKTWQFSRNSYCNRIFEGAFWETESLTEAEAMPKNKFRGPLARITKQGLAGWRKVGNPQSRASSFSVRQVIYWSTPCRCNCKKNCI